MTRPIAIATAIFSFTLLAYGDALDTWTKVFTATNESFRQIAYGNGIFVAVSDLPYNPLSPPYGGGGIATSSDGQSWTHYSTGGEISALAFGNGVFVTTRWDPQSDGDAGSTEYSTNGAGLVNADVIFSGLYGMTFGTNFGGRGMFVGVGHFYEGDVDVIITSTNGHDWIQQDSGVTNEFLTGIANGQGGYFAAIGYTNYLSSVGPRASVLFSTDGTNWDQFGTNFTQIPFSRPSGITCVKDIFYAIGPSITNAYFNASDSTLVFTPTNAPYPSIWVPIGSPSGTYVSVNSISNVYTSTNGINWTKRTTGITDPMSSIVFGNNRFVVGCSNGTILVSGTVAPTVTAQVNPGNGATQLTITGGLVSQATIQASSDLAHWSNLVTLPNLALTNYYQDLAATNFGARYYRTASTR